MSLSYASAGRSIIQLEQSQAWRNRLICKLCALQAWKSEVCSISSIRNSLWKWKPNAKMVVYRFRGLNFKLREDKIRRSDEYKTTGRGHEAEDLLIDQSRSGTQRRCGVQLQRDLFLPKIWSYPGFVVLSEIHSDVTVTFWSWPRKSLTVNLTARGDPGSIFPTGF